MKAPGAPAARCRRRRATASRGPRPPRSASAWGRLVASDPAGTTGNKWALPHPLTTKGDVFTFGTIAARLAVGSNDQVLTADSAQALGGKWAAPDPLTTKGDLPR